MINPTVLAVKTTTSPNWQVASKRVLQAYRSWYRAAPEIVSLYLLDISTSTVRAKIRQEFERNRFVQQLNVVDVLLAKSNAEFQETMNYWKQTPHLMKYFRGEEADSSAHTPRDFMTAFLEGRN